MKKVCLITPGHISTNPRLVKEAIALWQNGYKVHIIFTQYVAAQIRFDEEILKSNPNWSHDVLNWSGTSSVSKLNRLWGKVLTWLSLNDSIKLNRNFYWQRARACSAHADIYIAHNLGALPVAAHAAKKNGAKCGFDAEDFHRNEITDNADDKRVKLVIATENKYIPKLDHFTASSPIITERYLSLYDNLRVTTILNVFPKTRYVSSKNDPGLSLQIFWFSQTIGPGRGLEMVIDAISISKVPIHLHLLGQPTPGYVKFIVDNINTQYCQVVFHNTIAPDDIFKLAASFDIGLAAEPKVPLNRDICLTNKLFTYIQAGLGILASNTTAQKQFISMHPTIGKLYTSTTEFSDLLTKYHNNRHHLSETKNNSFRLGNEELNWETESQKFIALVNEVIPETNV